MAISIVDHDKPYRIAQEALAIMDRMALRYTGEPFPFRQGIALLVEPQKCSR